MLLLSKEFQKSMREGTADVTELADYLLKNNSSYELATSLAELMITAESYTPKKVVVSQEEMETILSVFRIRGISETGEKETRGRRKKKEGAP